MDNKDLDKILKDKLKNELQISNELEEKIRKKVEEEKKKKLQTIDINNTADKKNSKLISFKKLNRFASIAAVIILVFLVGAKLGNNPGILNLPGMNSKSAVVNIKAIEPTKLNNGIVARDSDFIIKTDGSKATKEDIQKSIYVEPALDYTIEKVSNDEFKLKFKQNIPNNTILKLQFIKNKITEDSWAYQTEEKLTVTSTYPDNDSGTVRKNSVIEIDFSYANVKNVEKNVEFNPDIKGTWKHLGSIWRFTPKSSLIEDQKYTVRIKKGIKAGDKTLEDNYIFNFTVDTDDKLEEKYKLSTITFDKIVNVKTNELAKIYFDEGTLKYSKSNIKINSIEIRKFSSSDDFIDYLETENYNKSVKLGGFKYTDNGTNIELKKTFGEGYYVAILKTAKGTEILNCPIQSNSLSAYAIETERDAIVWASNNGSLEKNINVEYLGKTEKTDKNGIATFKDIADGSEKVKYAKVGNGENKLVIGLYNYDLNNFPNSYLYTDRPLYKNTDTINIWGFVPRQLFYDKIEDEFYIELNDEGKQKVRVDEQGSITHKIELNNHYDNENALIKLYYKENIIATKYLSIENYELQNYTYNVIMDKNYAYLGENFKFSVEVSHITGLKVPNKKVAIEYKDKIYRSKTDKNGIANFSLKVKEDDENETIEAIREIAIFNGDDTEYTSAEKFIELYVLNRDVNGIIDWKNQKKFGLTLYKLQKNKKSTVSYDLHEIYDGKYNTDVKFDLEETEETRYISGYTYNEYTKEQEPDYTYEETNKNRKHITTITTKNGKLEFDENTLNLKKDTEEKNYSYTLYITYKDSNGKEIIEKEYVSNRDEYNDNTLGFSWMNEGVSYDGYTPYNTDYLSYYTFRYFLKKGEEKYSFVIGDNIDFTLAESTKQGTKDIQNNGKLLNIVFKENISKTEIIESNKFNYKFKESDFPGCKITAAYFYNGRFYRMPVYYFDFDSDDKKLDIDISSDKSEYKPGDKVTLTVKTTNKGKAVKSTVNVSVINKAVFELQEDITNIQEIIYEDKAYPVYTYSSYRDFITGSGGRRRRRRR